MSIEDIKELRAHYEPNDAIAKICDYLIEKDDEDFEVEIAPEIPNTD